VIVGDDARRNIDDGQLLNDIQAACILCLGLIGQGEQLQEELIALSEFDPVLMGALSIDDSINHSRPVSADLSASASASGSLAHLSAPSMGVESARLQSFPHDGADATGFSEDATNSDHVDEDEESGSRESVADPSHVASTMSIAPSAPMPIRAMEERKRARQSGLREVRSPLRPHNFRL
jgi:hypothetical protein